MLEVVLFVVIYLDRYVNVSYEPWAVNALDDLWRGCFMTTGEFTFNHLDGLRTGYRVLALSGPPLLAALLGGVLAECVGLTIVREASPGDRRFAFPARWVAALAGILVMLGCIGWWSAAVCHRWLTYREILAAAISSERYYRESHAILLDQPQMMEKSWHFSNLAEKEMQFARVRQQAVEALRLAEKFAAWEQIYEPATHRPWLPIPPNPPLDPSELDRAR